jgi:hypothetical protein
MSAMMGGEAGSQEDMFAKLENMRAVITEVNTQFKDPVGLICLVAHGRLNDGFLAISRKRRPSFVFVYQNSCLFTRRSD